MGALFKFKKDESWDLQRTWEMGALFKSEKTRRPPGASRDGAAQTVFGFKKSSHLPRLVAFGPTQDEHWRGGRGL